MDFPNNYILGALEKLPFLRKLKLIKNEFASVDLLGEQSYLKLFSKHFMITQITTLDIGEIISLDVLLALRSLFQKSPALTDLCLRFGDLWTDEYESENPNACLHWIDDLFAPFTVPYSSTPQYHYLSRLTVINGLHDPEEMGANFHNTFSTAFKNLDCVAFYGYGGNNYLLDHLNISGIRLRKLRIVCHDQNWEPITRIFCDAKLELLHLELELDAPGLKYNSLIPLICLSKDSLRELRLITISRRHSKLNSLEIMEENVAKQLVHSCRRLQNLELTADFKPGVWVRRINNFRASSIPDSNTYFRGQFKRISWSASPSLLASESRGRPI